MRYARTDYTLVRFERSHLPNKKYDAVLRNRHTGKLTRIPFGDSRYEQFKDTTGLGLWSHKDHGDNVRRRAYWDRHRKDMDYNDIFTAGYFSKKYLW